MEVLLFENFDYNSAITNETPNYASNFYLDVKTEIISSFCWFLLHSPMLVTVVSSRGSTNSRISGQVHWAEPGGWLKSVLLSSESLCFLPVKRINFCFFALQLSCVYTSFPLSLNCAVLKSEWRLCSIPCTILTNDSKVIKKIDSWSTLEVLSQIKCGT